MNAIRYYTVAPPTRIRTLMYIVLTETWRSARLSRGVDSQLVVSESLCILRRVTRYLSGKSYSSEVNAAYLPSRGKRLLCYTTCTSLTGVIYSITTVPLTSGRISLGNFETTKYREDNCYFVVKISLIYSNGRTKPAIKYQALVSSSFPRLNHLY